MATVIDKVSLYKSTLTKVIEDHKILRKVFFSLPYWYPFLQDHFSLGPRNETTLTSLTLVKVEIKEVTKHTEVARVALLTPNLLPSQPQPQHSKIS